MNTKLQSHSAILVTGATGFIGRHLLARLVCAGRRVVVLARRRAGATAQARIAELFGEAPQCPEILEGDLADTGQLKRALGRMTAEVETVIHCGGETFFGTAAQLPTRAVQIDGPLTILETLAARGLRRWSHVSTAFVCGRRSGVVREQDGDVGQKFHNPYEQVKLQAETAIRIACRTLGVGCLIHRPSIVIGPAPPTTGGAPSNLLFVFIRMLIAVARTMRKPDAAVRIAGSPSARFNIVPVEYVASAIAELSEDQEAQGRTFHLVAENPPTQKEVAEILSAQIGFSGLRVMAPGEELTRPSALELRIEKLLYPYREYLRQDVQFDASSARVLLERRNLPAPVIDRREIHRLVEMAICMSSRPCLVRGTSEELPALSPR